MKGNRQEAVGSRRCDRDHLVGAIHESPVPKFLKGADISSLLEVEECGGKFYDSCHSERSEESFSDSSAQAPQNDNAEDALTILQRHGVNLIRLRLWNDPYDENGTPYGAGTNDLARTMKMAARCKALGLPWLLDFHYSDFWADPGKQLVPKAWRGLDEDGLVRAVYEFTAQTLETLKAADLLPAMAAIGNEITNGLLWPIGKMPHFDAIRRFLEAGLRAVRQVCPEVQTMLHLDNGGNNALYRRWFDAYFGESYVDFDCIGLSYYPFWHGSIEDLRQNMNDLALRYGKPLIVAETSTAFTLEECAEREGLTRTEKRGLAANEKTAAAVPYTMTPEGQCAFLRDLAALIRQVPNGLGRGLIWWEPCWIPVRGSHWSTEAGLAYTGEQGPGGNEWANQALFDYNGRALPALHLMKTL